VSPLLPGSPRGDRHPIDRDALVQELIERFAFADRWGAVARTRELLAAGVDDGELRQVVALAARRVGELWQDGSWTVSQEHAATAVAEAVLGVIEVAVEPAPPVGIAAVVAAEGEWHALPGRLAAHAFERAGLGVHYLGAGVPATDIASSLPGTGAEALAVSVTLSANLVGAARTIAAGHAAGLPVLLGGAASTPARADALGADAHADDVDEGARIVRRWCQEGPPAQRGRPSVDVSRAAQLTAHRGRVIDEAYGAVERRWPALGEAEDDLIDRTVEDLELHLDHLAAALLLEEEDAYVDLVRWLAAVHTGRRLPPDALTAQLDGLDDAVGDEPALHELVAAGRAAVAR
jgi:methanogenic corrinoid protein MtbC1